MKLVKPADDGPEEAPSLVDRVYTHLLNRIIAGAIRYGDAISIKGVAAELSVSSMPVREAVKRLEFEGVVTIKPRSGCRVRVPSRRTILEVYEVREALEGYAVMHVSGASASGGGRDPGAIDRMKGIVEQMRLLASEPSADTREQRAIELDRQFHAEIIGLAGNGLLDSISRRLSVHVNMTLMHEKTYHALQDEWAEMHARIVDSIESDPQHCVQLLREQFARAAALWRNT